MQVQQGSRTAGEVRRFVFAAVAWLGVWAALVPAQTPAPAPTNLSDLDKRLVTLAEKGSQIMANLTYLSAVLGPRLTGSAALRRANEWTMAKMKEYGLENVHLEAWSMPEGWERGTATARIVEPNNGRSLSIASMGWSPGTPGKVTGEVVIVNAKNMKELEAYKGKLKNAILLSGPPTKLRPITELVKDKTDLFDGQKFGQGQGKGKGKEGKGKERKFNYFSEEMREFRKRQGEFYQSEGVAAVLVDAGKHHGLLNMTGSWAGPDRVSAVNRLPRAFIAHEHYALLHRLASRPAPAKTRIEIEITNKFVPGPVAVYNTVGEIRGSRKPEEVVIVGAHLDSWDLGQGTLDNGTGSMVVLETARILASCGTKPGRTIRFILFTGEEQGLHGSKAYVKQHKAEWDKINACIVHDTGTGRVLSLGWMASQEKLKPAVEKELACLKDLGVGNLLGRGIGGSDHASFATAGIPACIFRQNGADYGFAHHSNADTISLAREPELIQGAEVMSIMALRLANMEEMLPRTEPTQRKQKKAGS